MVSNNRRNAWLDSVLTIRLTTSAKPDLDSIVVLGPADGPWSGRALADDIVEVYRDEITRELGALPPATVRRIDNAPYAPRSTCRIRPECRIEVRAGRGGGQFCDRNSGRAKGVPDRPVG
jgi:hypothetical protein